MVSRTAALGLRAALDSIGSSDPGDRRKRAERRDEADIGFTAGALPRTPGARSRFRQKLSSINLFVCVCHWTVDV